MRAAGAPDAVQKTIVVRCGLETAFRTWTEQIDAWWPKAHTRSGNPATTIVLERRLGGRIYERTPDGVEHEWGLVTGWDPPRHFAYHWYLGSGAERPSQVEVRFTAEGDGRTRVEVRHRGPELLGAIWARNSALYDAAWAHLLPAYQAFVE